MGSSNGHDNYPLLLVSQNYLLQYLINNTHQKEFSVLEVGAGNFQFGRAQAAFINQQINKGILDKDIIVNFISIRGESNLETPYSKMGNCQLWELGSFKIENLTEKFKAKNSNLDLENKFDDLTAKFDLVVSHYTMRHLVDPVGTFLQIHDVLKLDGILLTDTFQFKIQDYTEGTDSTGVLLLYLQNAGDEVLVRNFKDYPALVVKKHSEEIKLPFEYNSIISTNKPSESYHEVLTIFEEPDKKALQLIEAIRYWERGVSMKKVVDGFAGSKSLFQELTKAFLLEKQAELEAVKQGKALSLHLSQQTLENLEETIKSLSTEDCQQFNVFYSYYSNPYKYIGDTPELSGQTFEWL